MAFSPRLRASLYTAFLLFVALAGRAGAQGNTPPLLDDPIQANRVVPTFPVGKTLLFPLTASDADGDALTYDVRSTDPKVLVRVKTGNPHLRLIVNYAGDGTPAHPAIVDGVLEFQLLHDLTPVTADIIGGMAQSGFYNNLIFHRIVDEFVAQGGDPAGNGTGGPGFTFENEFHPALTFTGRGQLAMANSGTNQTTYAGTNGSQFFITERSPRHLDFNHTIFGQLVRGWEVFDQIMAVPTSSGSAPTVPVTITSATIVPNLTDAVLILSAIGLSNTKANTITVKVSDGHGGVAEKRFKATAVADTENSPPFLVPPANAVVPPFTILSVPLQTVDLEFDLMSFANGLVGSSALSGQRGQDGSTVLVRGNPGYTGPLTLAVGATQFDVTHRGAADGAARDFDDLLAFNIGVGDREIRVEPVTIEAQPGVVLTSVDVAKFVDRNFVGAVGNFAAAINWGDHAPGVPATSAGTIVRDTSRPGLTAFAVQGTHTFGAAGVYPVSVTITDVLGYKVTARSTAIVSGAPFRATGRTLDIVGSSAASRVVATFTDAAPLPLDAYAATINWGDGIATSGKVRFLGEGRFSVSGVHGYRDAETYSITVRIVRDDGTNPATEALAWSTARVSGISAPRHLPPFPQAHLTVELPDDPVKVRTGAGATLRTFMKVRAIMRNSGNKVSAATPLRFYLSKDKVLNTTGPNADIPLTIGALSQITIPPFRAGGGTAYSFDVINGVDYRLRAPAGETTIGYNLLASLPYKDPIGDHQNVARIGLYGPMGIIASPEKIGLTENPADLSIAHATNISVVLDELPAADVTIGVSTSDGRITVTHSTTGDPITQLVFTPANAKTAQTLRVTAVDDALANGTGTSQIIFAPTVSTDPVWSARHGSDVTVTVFDND